MWVNLLLVLLYWIAAGLVLSIVLGRMIAFADKFSGMENRVSGIEKRLGGLETYMRQGLELMNAKVDAVDQKIEHKIEFLQGGKRSPAESVSKAGND
jgi:hypothetical protein